MGTLNTREGKFDGWQYQETLLTGTNSEPIPIPPLGRNRNITITLLTTGGNGKIQITTSAEEDLSSAVWQDWAPGSCTENTTDGLLSPVTAIRLVRTSGTVKIEIVI